MTYQYVDAPANRTSVISAIVNFAVANAGFALVDGDGDFQSISKSGLYWCLAPRSASTYVVRYEIGARLTTVVPTADDYTTVTGQELLSGFGLSIYTGPYTGLHLFSNGAEVNAVLEVVPGAFSHLSFGTINKFGTFTGGQYLTGSVYTVRNEGAWSTNRNKTQPYDGGLCTGGNNGWTPADYYRNAMYYNSSFYPEAVKSDNRRVVWGGVESACNTPLYNQGYASYNYRRALLPIYAIIEETDARSKVIGVSAQARFLNLSGLQNKEIIESDWMVFPYSQRTAIIGTGYDATYGLAYKK